MDSKAAVGTKPPLLMGSLTFEEEIRGAAKTWWKQLFHQVVLVVSCNIFFNYYWYIIDIYVYILIYRDIDKYQYYQITIRDKLYIAYNINIYLRIQLEIFLVQESSCSRFSSRFRGFISHE